MVYGKATERLDGLMSARDKAKLNWMEDASVPRYWLGALREGAQAINTALCEAGANKSAFLFYTDAHWNYGSGMSPRLLKYLYRHTGMTKTNFGGDIVHDESAEYNTMEYLWNWRRQLKDLPNHHSVVGNHDDGNATNNLFSQEYVYGYLLGPEETEHTVRDRTGMYYYIDNGAEHTRYLYLDTAYKGVTDGQLAFVKQALLTAPDDWHIVAIAHIWYDTDYTTSPPSPGSLNSGAAALLSMFDSYNGRVGDYSACGGWVEFCIGGHTHRDYDGTSPSGIPILLMETDSRHVRNGKSGTRYVYKAGTDTESSVSGIIADYDRHKIHVIRIGRGESREVAITNYTVSYTNRIPLAVGQDGSGVYNSIGYKADTRWSTSTHKEGTASGIYLTGYIPCTAGDIVRLKNITMSQNASSSTPCMLHFFSGLTNASEANYNAANITNYAKGVWGGDGNLTQFTVEAGSQWKYFRVQCGGISADSVITVNELIE